MSENPTRHDVSAADQGPAEIGPKARAVGLYPTGGRHLAIDLAQLFLLEVRDLGHLELFALALALVPVALGAGADVLVLACTHYPLIAPLLRRLLPESMQIVDSAESTARVVKKMLAADGATDHRTFRFYVTDSVDKFKRLAARFLGRQVDKVEHVNLEAGEGKLHLVTSR